MIAKKRSNNPIGCCKALSPAGSASVLVMEWASHFCCVRLHCYAATAARVPTYAAMHSFLYGYQCLRHPQDPARFEDAEAMLGVCEHVLEKGLP